MQVVAGITLRDVFVVGFQYMLRARWMWAICTLGFMACLWLQWHSNYAPTDWVHSVYFMAIYGAFWLVLLVVMALYTAAVMTWQVSSKSGVIGSHTFEIRKDGLFVSTSANQTLTYWSAIPCAIRKNHYILVFLSWWIFHCIPRRAFPDSAAYDAFFNALQQRIRRNANSGAEANGRCRR